MNPYFSVDTVALERSRSTHSHIEHLYWEKPKDVCQNTGVLFLPESLEVEIPFGIVPRSSNVTD